MYKLSNRMYITVEAWEELKPMCPPRLTVSPVHYRAVPKTAPIIDLIDVMIFGKKVLDFPELFK